MLWDTKRAKLVYHWPKLYERHTILQPSTRGFGGIVQLDMLNDFPYVEGFAYCTFCGRRFSHNQLMGLFNRVMTKIEKNVIIWLQVELHISNAPRV
ncbi:unnamed protein product [Prunus armeniaca]